MTPDLIELPISCLDKIPNFLETDWLRVDHDFPSLEAPHYA
jgi:hypothetical protein